MSDNDFINDFLLRAEFLMPGLQTPEISAFLRRVAAYSIRSAIQREATPEDAEARAEKAIVAIASI